MTDQATKPSLTDGTDGTIDEPTPETGATDATASDDEGNQHTEQPVGDDSESSQPADSAQDAPTSPQAGHRRRIPRPISVPNDGWITGLSLRSVSSDGFGGKLLI